MNIDPAYVRGLENTIEQLNAQIENMGKQISDLNDIISLLRKSMFGSSSEKTPREEIPDQLCIFNEVEISEDPKQEEPAFTTPKGSAKLRKNSRKEMILKELPVEEIIYDLEDDDKVCDVCGTSLKSMGKEFVREEIEFIPASLKVLRYYRLTYECPKCKHTDKPFIVGSVVPTSLMNHSLASPSSVANVMYQKYVNSIPLYRQEKDWEQMGLILRRATMANWVIRCSEDYFTPIIARLHELLLSREVIHADETPVQVLKEEGKKPQTKSYMWLYRTGNDGREPIVLYDYRPGRGGYNADEYLKGFKGYLHSDGFSGYNVLKDVTRCGCWAHVRRKFVEACPKEKAEGTPESVAETGRDLINKLFDIERDLKDLSQDERYTRRLEQEKPVLEAFWSWLDKQNASTRNLREALQYARNQKPYLENYLLDGRCSISNNTAENAIRPFTVGRKNWLFSDTPKGARSSAAVYSIVETAKANSLNVYAYLEYLLRHMPDCDWRNHPDELDDLLPWSEEVKAACSK